MRGAKKISSTQLDISIFETKDENLIDTIEKSKNQYLYDVDGNQYIDFISSWGPMILGHSNEKILNSVKNKIDLGTSFGIPTELETKIAK